MKIFIKIFALSMILLSVVMLYNIKEKTDDLKKQQAQLISQIKDDVAALKILKIEKDYLSRPARLERLSARYLGLNPITTTQFISSLDNINIGVGLDRDAAVQQVSLAVMMPREKPVFKISEESQSLRKVFTSLKSNKIFRPSIKQSSDNIYKSPVKLTSYAYKPTAKKTSYKPHVKKIGFKDRLRAKFGGSR